MNLTVKFSGPCKQFGVLKKKALITGKKTTSPAGIEHERVKGGVSPPKLAPVRNHIGPCWPTMQSWPVVSSVGLLSAGIESTHCHHWAVSGRRPVCASAAFVEHTSAAQIARTAKDGVSGFIDFPPFSAQIRQILGGCEARVALLTDRCNGKACSAEQKANEAGG